MLSEFCRLLVALGLVPLLLSLLPLGERRTFGTCLNTALYTQSLLLLFVSQPSRFGRIIYAFDDIHEPGLNDLDLLLLHLRKSVKFQMTTISAILAHKLNILIERLVVHKASKFLGSCGEMIARLLA